MAKKRSRSRRRGHTIPNPTPMPLLGVTRKFHKQHIVNIRQNTRLVRF